MTENFNRTIKWNQSLPKRLRLRFIGERIVTQGKDFFSINGANFFEPPNGVVQTEKLDKSTIVYQAPVDKQD
jgi:hypothetical protein